MRRIFPDAKNPDPFRYANGISQKISHSYIYFGPFRTLRDLTVANPKELSIPFMN